MCRQCVVLCSIIYDRKLAPHHPSLLGFGQSLLQVGLAADDLAVMCQCRLTHLPEQCFSHNNLEIKLA